MDSTWGASQRLCPFWSRCIFCAQPSCFRAGGDHFLLVPDICVWYHSPDFEADWPPTHTAPVGFWDAESWASSRRGGGVWVGSQWKCAVIRVNTSDVTWIVLMKTLLSASGRPIMLCLHSSAAHQNVDFPHHLRKQYFLLITSSEVFSKGYTLCLSPSVVSVLSTDDSAWIRYQRAFLAPSRGQEGAPQNCSLRSCEGPPGRSHSLEHCYSSSPLLLLKDSRNWWPGSLRLPHQFILRMPSGWVSLWLQGSEGESPILCVSRQNA